MEVHWSAHGEAYVTPVGDDLVGVAILSHDRRGYDEHLAGFPALTASLRGPAPPPYAAQDRCANGCGTAPPDAFCWSATPQATSTPSPARASPSHWQRPKVAANLSKAGDISVPMPAADTQAPTTPGTPTASTPYTTTVNLSWPASTDNWAVTDYLVYRDGVLAATTSSTSTAVYGETPGQTYQFTVKARDAADSLSPASPPVSATTPTSANLALNGPATALFLDGSPADMQTNSTPALAVDGDLSTYAQARNQYAWQLQIDLGSSHAISSVVTTMPSDKFATEYNIAISQDGQNWTVADKVTGFMGGVSTQNLATPVTARYLRIVAVKPDGGGQTGGQMAISELAVYGS